ncbi:MAG: hypothetical protein EXS06_04975 [Planctomycetaceae bacterium]|nr:hypothetical protein [Planctomycetaceae bacterium]
MGSKATSKGDERIWRGDGAGQGGAGQGGAGQGGAGQGGKEPGRSLSVATPPIARGPRRPLRSLGLPRAEWRNRQTHGT